MNRISIVFFPVLTLNFPTDLEHVHEPLPSVFLVVHLDVLHELCEVISQHLLCEHARWVEKLDRGLVALGTPVFDLPVELCPLMVRLDDTRRDQLYQLKAWSRRIYRPNLP